MSADPQPSAARRFPCEQCGASLQYAPGTRNLKCEYCGHENRIPEAAASRIEEIDFRETLATLAARESLQETITHHCDGCGAEFSFDPAVHAGDCPFCGAPVVAATRRHRQLPVNALLPFAIPRDQVRDRFRHWLQRLWFAPNRLKHYARDDTKITGMYVPYWTYDADTVTHYAGERGDHYQVPETYTTVENGREVTRTRMVTKVRWHPAAGVVSRRFDDVLVLAGESLPRAITEQLEPWDLANLQPYQEDYLSGFRSEMYQVDLQSGFERACALMAPVIEMDIRRDIGGDEQRIHQRDTRYGAVSFKHILLPIWVSAFRFRDRVYRFVVNGRTGEVQGERPYSAWKIALAILLGLLAAGGLFLLLRLHENPEALSMFLNRLSNWC